jgi:hypothetical protein
MYFSFSFSFFLFKQRNLKPRHPFHDSRQDSYRQYNLYSIWISISYLDHLIGPCNIRFFKIVIAIGVLRLSSLANFRVVPPFPKIYILFFITGDVAFLLVLMWQSKDFFVKISNKSSN